MKLLNSLKYARLFLHPRLNVLGFHVSKTFNSETFLSNRLFYNGPVIYSVLKENEPISVKFPSKVLEEPFNVSSSSSDTENGSISVEKDEESLLKSSSLQDVSSYAPALKPSFNLAAYANVSPTLQEFVKLGVELYKFEKQKDVAEYILSLDFERDVKKYLLFLHDVGVLPSSFGEFVTKNPYIFKEDLNNLQVRINYLSSKKFSSENIARIVTKNPKWLSIRTQDIDARLGYFQKTFNLTGEEVRYLATKQPRLVTYSLGHIKTNIFSLTEEMGFNDKELKAIILNKPRLLMKNRESIVNQFNYIHNEMKISHELIMKQPEALVSRQSRTEQRHLFLVSLGRAQYDPKLPGYVSLKALVSGNDAQFCRDVAKCSLNTFNLFMKTLL